MRPLIMKEGTFANFGLLIAYVVPGFATVWAFSYYSPMVAGWLQGTAAELPTVGGFLYVTLASIAAGLTVSTVRWMLIDTLHHATGIRQVEWDFSRLQANIDAFRVLVEIHYRYYQFYANTVIAVAFLYVAVRGNGGQFHMAVGLLDVLFVTVEVVLLAGSRDTLRKYYLRGTQLLAPAASAAPTPLLVPQAARHQLEPSKPPVAWEALGREANNPPGSPECSLPSDYRYADDKVLGELLSAQAEVQ